VINTPLSSTVTK